jgi:RNA ligase (TIGR02306 family)
VRLTEKIHGTNSRVGLIDNEFMCGSHKCSMKSLDKLEHPSIYWNPLTSNMKDMLRCISDGGKNVIAFGEIYGSKVQFMDYGRFGADGYALFDISVDGTYLNWDQIVYYTTRFCIPLVPLLYTGPFDYEVVEQLVDGDTIIGDKVHMRSAFKGREGVVITPLTETFSPILGGRLILKAVSVDYLEIRRSDFH